MSLDTAISETQRTVPECLAVGVVEMNTGMLLGVRTVDSHPQEVLDLVAAATGDIYQGQNVVAIENAFRRSRGVAASDEHYFQEIIILSKNLIHVFQRGKVKSDIVMVTVCRNTVNLGMALSKSRVMMTKVEEQV